MSEGPSRLKLEWLPGRYAVCRLEPHEAIPNWALNGLEQDGLVSVTKTAEELSIVIDEGAAPAHVRGERGFAAMRIAGTLDFSLVGVLAKLTNALASASIPVFVVSTFDTDLLLVRAAQTGAAFEALKKVAEIQPITQPPRGVP